MSPDRFEALAQAYGGDLARWPQGDRAGGERLLAGDPAAAASLARAQSLDRALAADRVHGPTADLRRRTATALLARSAARGRLARWLRGLGALGALGAGAMAGAGAIAAVAMAWPVGVGPAHPWDDANASYAQSSFGDLEPGEDAAAAAKT